MIDNSMKTYACKTATTICRPMKMMGTPIGIMERKTRVIRSPAKMLAHRRTVSDSNRAVWLTSSIGSWSAVNVVARNVGSAGRPRQADGIDRSDAGARKRFGGRRVAGIARERYGARRCSAVLWRENHAQGKPLPGSGGWGKR